jgi:HEAT repeat protein
MRRAFLCLSLLFSGLSAYPPANLSAQTAKVEQTKVAPELQARIRKLIATLGPDLSRGTCTANFNLPTNQAKEELIAIGKPATLALCAVLKEKDLWRRIMAAEALTEIHDRRAIKPLLQTLQRDPSGIVRGEAAKALGKIGDPTTVETLIDALKVRIKNPKERSSPAYVASQAAWALGNIGDRRAIPALLPLLGSREPYDFQSSPLGKRVAAALGELGPEAVEPLMQALQHLNRDVRADAARALGMMKERRAAPLLMQALQHPDRKVRTDAAIALGFMKERRAVPLLLSLLTPPTDNDEDPWENVSNEDYDVSVAVIGALGEIGDKRATQPLLKNVSVKRLQGMGAANYDNTVIVALGKIGDPQAVETLLQLLPSRDDLVRVNTLEALWRIKTPKCTEILLQVLQQGEDFLVSRAVEWLGEMQEVSALPALNKLLETEDEEANYGFRDRVAIAIGRIDSNILLSCLNDNKDDIRRAAVYGLGVIGCTQVVPRLLPMLTDKELGDRAMDALGNLGTPELLPRLEALMRDPNYPHRSNARRAVIAIKRRHDL